jgi:hypothetical protein
MTKTERERFIKELVSSIQKDLLYESGKYPDSCTEIELDITISSTVEVKKSLSH